MKNWSQHYRIVYDKFCDMLRKANANEKDISMKAMSLYLGVSPGKGEAWKKGQWPSAEDLATIAAKLGFSYRWLVTGEGDPEGDAVPFTNHCAEGTSACSAMRGAIAPLEQPNPEKDARVTELEAELRAREKELLEAKNEIISLQRKLLG